LFVRALQRLRKKFTRLHPPPRRAASQDQREKNSLKENEMTKLLSTVAAFALFAPIAVAILTQAAQIVA
jgi:hypothetical protein